MLVEELQLGSPVWEKRVLLSGYCAALKRHGDEVLEINNFNGYGGRDRITKYTRKVSRDYNYYTPVSSRQESWNWKTYCSCLRRESKLSIVCLEATKCVLEV
ncbi:uncharacterized protein LOC130747359 [Lotus japonicus]|uniref:uncharacterized protein LOC130747359 n=1 Tax=Lotus japonicus TaxID=34305 RepID=UPI00258E00B4|nr:uncharacterized protein LOC130747359 [Lotus japonicus]